MNHQAQLDIEADNHISKWFEDEVKIYEGELRAYLCTRLPKTVEVDDVIQNCYKRIISVKRRTTVITPRGLLFKIACNLLLDEIGKKYNSKTDYLADMDNFDVLNNEVTPINTLTQLDDHKILEDAIRTLPKRCQRIFIYFHFEKLSQKEIAKRLGISVNTIQTQLAIGLKKCRKYFVHKNIL